MNRQLNVNLMFTADTAQAKQQIQQLQSSLNSVANMPLQLGGGQLTPKIKEASLAAMELKTHLQNAVNVNTGTLDFAKLNASIQASGTSISQYAAKLLSIGPTGRQAFMQLANSVAQAEVPIRRSNTLLSTMMTTLKNTAKWQLASTAIHGMVNAISSAYNYAQDLDESLNNIRIVTAKSAEEMQRFAKQANEAAKALNTSTTAYTNASLIYYQQGLSDQQVKERTEVTLKMANVSKQSAEVVSDQLTAIWNNFDDGTQSLESYVDIITALGAATASSSKEISDGLEKFASVAKTVGLSYEYATAALATVTATTRQSADVVGTAFKTLFARLQDLKLGETLDDGTTLGSYSANLAKVGVEIQDASGQLKDMDVILEELAAKWDQLDRGQQVALAKGVAGIRQYNTFLSLMSNWDFMEKNLQVVEKSGGTLEKQAEIYGESWEAAKKQVRAAMESLYSSLMDPKFFINLSKGLEKIASVVDFLTKSLGGLSGILSTVSALLLKTFSNKIAVSIQNMAHNIYASSQYGQQQIQKQKSNEINTMATMMANTKTGTGDLSPANKVASQEYQNQLSMQRQLIDNQSKMDQTQIANCQQILDLRRQIADQVIDAAKREESATTNIKNLYSDMLTQKSAAMQAQGQTMSQDDIRSLQQHKQALEDAINSQERLENAVLEYKQALLDNDAASDDETIDLEEKQQAAQRYRAALVELSKALKEANPNMSLSGRRSIIQDVKDSARTGDTDLETQALQQSRLNLTRQVAAATNELTQTDKVAEQTVNQMANSIRQANNAKREQNNLINTGNGLQDQFNRKVAEGQNKNGDWAKSITAGASGVMSLVSAVRMASSLIDTLTNPDATGWEKFFAVLSSGSMILMMTMSAMSSFAIAKEQWTKGALKSAAATTMDMLATKLNTAAEKHNTQATLAKERAKNKSARTSRKKATSELVDKAATDKNSKGVKSLGQSFKNLGGALKNFIASYGAAIGMIAAAIAIVVTTIAVAINQFKRYDKAAQDAANAAEMVKDSQAQAKEAYDSFINTQNDYNDIVKSMQEMTKGTLEYKEAMVKANEQALNLIKNYKSLAGQYTIKDGLIVIDEDALAKAQEEALGKMGKSQAISILSQQQAAQAKAEADRVKFNRSTKSKSDHGYTAANAAVGGTAGAAAGFLGTVGTATLMGSSAGPWGMAIGALVGLAVGAGAAIVEAHTAGIQSKKEEEATQQIIQYVDKNGNDIFAAKNAQEFEAMLKKADININDTKLIQSLYDNKDALEELTAVEVRRLEQERAEWATAYGAYNAGNSTYTDFNNQTFLNNMGQQTSQDSAVQEEVTNEVEDLWKGRNLDFWEAYLQEVMQDENVIGATGDNYQVIDRGGGNVTLQKKNEEGVWETIGDKNGLNEKAAQQQLIQARLLQRASESMSEDIATYSDLALDLRTSGLGYDNQDVIDTILNDFSSNQAIDLSQFGPEIVSTIVTDAIKDPLLQKEVENAITEYNRNIPKWYEGLTEEEKQQAWNLNIDKEASIDEVKSVLLAMQNYIDSTNLSTTITVSTQMEEALNNMEWDTLKTLWDGPGGPGEKGHSWDKFIALGSMDAMKSWLSDWEKGILATQETAAVTTIEEAKQNYNTTKQNMENAEDVYEETKKEADKKAGVATTQKTEATIAQGEYETQVQDNYDQLWDDLAVATGQYTNNYGNETGWSYDEVIEYLHNLNTSENIDFGNFLSLSQGYWKYLTGGNQQEGWTFTDAQGAVWNRDTIGQAWANEQSRIAGIVSGVTDVNGNYIITDPNSEEWQKFKDMISSYGAFGYETLVRDSTATGEEYSTMYKLTPYVAAIAPYLSTIMNPEVTGELKENYDTQQAEADAAEAEVKEYGEDTDTDPTTKIGKAYSDWQDKITIFEGVEGDENRPGAQAALNKAYQTDIELQEAHRKNIESYGLDYDLVEGYQETLETMAATKDAADGIADSLASDRQAAREAAKEMTRFARSVDSLSSNYDDWLEALESDVMSDQIAAAKELDSVYSDMLDLDNNTLSQEFLQEAKNLELAKEAAQGSAEAYNELQIKASSDILLHSLGEVPQFMEAIIAEIANIEGIDVGEKIKVGENDVADKLLAMYQNAYNAAIVGGQSVAEGLAIANDLMAAEGFQSDIQMVEKTIYYSGQLPKGAIPQPGGTFIGPDGQVLEGYTWQETESGTYTNSMTMMVPESTNISFTKSSENKGGSNFKSNNSSGGGSKPKKADTKKKKDVVNRYKEVNDAITDISNTASQTNTAMDGLYGKARINAMKKVNDLLKNEIDLLSKKRKEALGYLAEDKQALNDAASEAGVTLEFDADGDISNYTNVMTGLYNELDAAITAANADGNATEEEQEKIDAIQEKIDNLKDAMADYEETKDLLFEIDQEQIDKFNEQLSNNFEQINATIELGIEFNEQDLQYIEYMLSKIEEDVYSQAEAAALTSGQLSIYGDNLEVYKQGFADLESAYANGEISQASYVEGMKSISEGLLENLGNIQELDNAMKEYYGNTISMAQDEISKYTDLMENATTVLDHYQSLMELFGQQTDYEKMGDILVAKATVSKDAYDVSAATYNMFREQADAAKQAFEDAKAAGTTGYELDVLEQEWFDAETAANEAQDQMLADAEEWAENMRAVLENSLAGFAQQLEDALTGEFGSFDALSTELERASSLQEEYLTTTNKIYETNKLMRTAQKEIDKTTNQMAKRKLKEFINETAALQEQGKLSQYELEIQQAKYDLLLAEIALKEAQNAKSTVRLQRDSEGNFGYVYTADQSAIDDAQQKFDDSQNALYNKGLEGANNYAQKYIETMSEMNDALAEANQKYLDGEYKDVDEYNDAIDSIREYYYQKMEDYSSLYQVALDTDSRVTKDAWSSAFGDMTRNTEQWKIDTERYIGQSKEAFEQFNKALAPMKSSLSASAKSIKEITGESAKLKTTLTEKDGVIDSLGKELTAVKQVTDAYAAQRAELDSLLTSYQNYATAAANNAENAAFDENVIAPGSEIALKKTAAWSADVGDADDYSDKTKGPNVDRGYTVLRWDVGKKNVLISDGAGSYGWVPINNLVGFDTGGYTGEWGSYGKMAMVHEKELILNPHDTENFLASMEFLHKILEVIDLQAMSSQLGGILSSPGMLNTNMNTIEQNVHIEASFPNATNHSEIEEAFNNLINTSSQYANRK